MSPHLRGALREGFHYISLHTSIHMLHLSLLMVVWQPRCKSMHIVLCDSVGINSLMDTPPSVVRLWRQTHIHPMFTCLDVVHCIIIVSVCMWDNGMSDASYCILWSMYTCLDVVHCIIVSVCMWDNGMSDASYCILWSMYTCAPVFESASYYT